jgi:hypothetical protein
MRPLPLILLVGCSEYSLEGRQKPSRSADTAELAEDTSPPEDSPAGDSDPPPDSASPEDSTIPEDDDLDGEVDEAFDENGNGIPDCSESELYCTPFDDFSDWSYAGSGDWHIESGMLTEGRSGLYDAVAWLHDLGLAARFSIQVDLAWTGSLNDLAGIAWAVDGDRSVVVRWDDPQGDYGRYSPTGAIDISSCEGGGCTILHQDSSADLYRPADLSFSTLAVMVDGSQVDVTVDGLLVLSTSLPELEGLGPGVVGLYSNDNDGGVWFDNYCVWVDEG